MRDRDGQRENKSREGEDRNKGERVGRCVGKIDEIVIASCFLMAGLQGRGRATRAAEPLPSASDSRLPIVTNGIHLQRQSWMIHLVNTAQINKNFITY